MTVLANKVPIAGLLQKTSSGKRRRRSQYACSVTMHCSPQQARFISDEVAREQQYCLVAHSPSLVRYVPERGHRRQSSFPALEAHFMHERGETTVTIVGYRRSKLRQLLRPSVSTRAEVVVFRDQVWFYAAQAQVPAKVL